MAKKTVKAAGKSAVKTTGKKYCGGGKLFCKGGKISKRK